MTVRVYASADGSLDSSDVLLGTVQKNMRLKPRAGARVAVTLPTPANLPDGNYFLLAQVDDSSPVAATKKAVAFVNPFADVAVQFNRLPSQPVEIDGPSAGASTVCARITNAGNIAARGTVSLNFYLSADATLDSADPLLATMTNQSIALKPNASRAVSFRVAIPPGTAVGAYFLFATVNPIGGLTDNNSANNTTVSNRRIAVVTQLPYPTRVDHYHSDYYYDNGSYYYYGVGAYAVDTGVDYYSADYADDSSSDNSYDNSGAGQSYSAPDNGSSDSSGSSDGSSSDSWSSEDYVSSGGDF